jgi:hypothetical protein
LLLKLENLESGELELCKVHVRIDDDAYQARKLAMVDQGGSSKSLTQQSPSLRIHYAFAQISVPYIPIFIILDSIYANNFNTNRLPTSSSLCHY